MVSLLMEVCLDGIINVISTQKEEFDNECIHVYNYTINFYVKNSNVSESNPLCERFPLFKHVIIVITITNIIII